VAFVRFNDAQPLAFRIVIFVGSLKMAFSKHITTLCMVSVLASFDLLAQQTSDLSYQKNIYRKSWHLGAILHTSGIGASFRKENYKTALIKHFWTLEAYNLKHPKEQKTFGANGDDSKSFVYGKLNHLYVLKGGIGRQKTLFEKEEIRGVQISTVYNINASLGFLKPVYLEVYKKQPDNQVILVTERYDPDQHTINQIAGKASWAQGINETRLVPGLSAKFGLNFEFAPKDEKIKAIELGINVDGFFGNMEVMAFQREQYVFTNLYLNFQFGRKRYL
jgi:hypothetical protein